MRFAASDRSTRCELHGVTSRRSRVVDGAARAANVATSGVDVALGADMRSFAFLIPALVACSSSETHSDTAKLPPNQPQCNFVNYHRDEAVNVQGPGRCTTDCDCDGMRSCTGGTCSGEARPTDNSHCNDPSYHWNEAWNGGGSGVCASDCECEGTRTCVSGHCADSATAPKAGDMSKTQ